MVRISIGLVSLTLSILFAARALGFLPDREPAILEGRQALSESIAIACSHALHQKDMASLQPYLEDILQRNPDILSAGIRDAGGKLVVEVGPHDGLWKEGVAEHSTPTHVHLPLGVNDQVWGEVELRFRPVGPTGLLAVLLGNMASLTLFVLLASFVANFFYLRTVLRHADPAQAKVIPERVRATLNTVAEGILVLDRQERIALANDAFARTIGQSPQELQGRRASELAWEGDTSSREYPWARALREAAPHLGTILTLRANREGQATIRRRVSVNSAPILADDGTCRGALATFDDLTPLENRNDQLRKLLRRLNRSRKKIQEQKSAIEKAKEAAEAASRAKSEFLANVSHEIRTPMNAILGMTEVVLDSPLPAAEREYLEIVRASGDSLLTVINDLLDYSKIEAGKFQLDPIELDLWDCLGDTLKTLALRAHKKGLELACDIAKDVPIHLIGDPGRVRQILINLVGNAIKFTEQGEIVVRVTLQEEEVDQVQLLFAVMDTGIGIPEHKLQTIFEPFTQADGSTTRKYGGTGLGLTISSHLVELMGGRIWVESKVGQGSSFLFTARFGLQQPARTALLESSLSALKGLPILVVDDNATSRRILEQVLAPLETRTVVASSAAEARAVIQQAQTEGRLFALILIDIQMPGEDGFALISQLREEGYPACALVPLLSCVDQAANLARCRQLGLSASVSKPIKPMDVYRALGGAMGVSGLVTGQGNRPAGSLEEMPPSVELPRLNILLVDDNPFNQRVGALKLEKLGQHVQVVGSGHAALEALAKQHFDAMLLDMQMPDMDGLEVTAAIRAQEKGTGLHLPIIAATAHAMKGDRDRCLAGGMDGYVAKPIQDHELAQALRAILPLVAARPRVASTFPAEKSTEPSAGSSQDTVMAIAPSAVLNRDVTLSRVGGNVRLLRELSEVFQSDCARLKEEVEAALQAGDASRLQRAGHTLKGMVSFFAATTATEAAFALENMGRAGNLSEAAPTFATLVKEIDQIKENLVILCAESPT